MVLAPSSLFLGEGGARNSFLCHCSSRGKTRFGCRAGKAQAALQSVVPHCCISSLVCGHHSMLCWGVKAGPTRHSFEVLFGNSKTSAPPPEASPAKAASCCLAQGFAAGLHTSGHRIRQAHVDFVFKNKISYWQCFQCLHCCGCVCVACVSALAALAAKHSSSLLAPNCKTVG